uniref:Uncharacterized protein n=1 Tax=Oryza punctata TaxID=4537 RepID=A0A0E0JE00_ORYPU
MMQVGRDNLEMLQVSSYSLDMGAAGVAGEEHRSGTPPPGQFVKELLGMGSLTLAMAAGTLVYKPPHGLLFQRHVLAYYLTLVVIFFAGVAEVWTSFWLSEALDNRRQRPCRHALGRAMLWASVVPLAAIAGIGGYTVLTMQADNNNLEIGAADEAQDAGEELGSVKKKLNGVGFVTLAMAVSTLVHKPADHDVLFQRHAVAYYLTLMVIFLAGVVEVWTALWVSNAGESGRSRRAFGSVVLCASVVPLAAVAGIGGYTVMVNMFS